MSLPTWLDLKYLVKAQTATEDGGSSDSPAGTGNGLLARMIERATARVERYLQRPITAESLTATDRAESIRVWGVIDQLVFPLSPLSQATLDAPVLVDVDGETVDPTTYDIDYAKGLFIAHRGISFDNGPYTMTAVAGLSADPRYASFEPDLAQAILDVAVDLYTRREAAVVGERAGGGVARDYDRATGLPVRVCQALDQYRRIGWA